MTRSRSRTTAVRTGVHDARRARIRADRPAAPTRPVPEGTLADAIGGVVAALATAAVGVRDRAILPSPEVLSVVLLVVAVAAVPTGLRGLLLAWAGAVLGAALLPLAAAWVLGRLVDRRIGRRTDSRNGPR